MRTSTSSKGAPIEAAAEKIVGSTVYLRTADGKKLSIRLYALSEADQAYAKEFKEKAREASKPRQLSGGLKRPSGSRMLTDEQIKNLLTDWTDPKGKKYKFVASFGMARVSSSDKRKYAKSGKVPVRITASLYELVESRGKMLPKRMSGKAHLVVLDSEGNETITKRSSSLSKMCPS